MFTKLLLQNSLRKPCYKLISTSAQAFRKVTLLGAAGNVGQPLALLLKSNPVITKLALYDTSKSIVCMAKDLSLVNTPTCIQYGYGQRQLKYTLQDSEVVVIAAGIPRKSGERDDLFDVNGEIVYDLASECTKYCPNAMVVLITNPLNALVPLLSELYKQKECYDPKRIFGVTALDTIRTRTLISNYLQKPLSKSTKIPIIGGHSFYTIIPVLSQVKKANIKFDTMEDYRNLILSIRCANNQVLDSKGNVTVSMAYAAAKFCNSLIAAMNGAKNIYECAYVKSNEDILPFMASQLRLSTDGIAENYGCGLLNDYEKRLLDDAVPYLLCDIKKGVDFITEKNLGNEPDDSRKISCAELFGVSVN
ncbi:malate dehydrogenase, mitochondrial-like [Chrysoperla carnea]|uniref:malate dehydrogenase, mitochondrial-like n=1 Tax=Chrysoperla carnea TaxID=189513 RepID=UPI001D0784D9|nr:malate dehydrogenase, mitochondrial-like [Chrysoperla carnea]